MDKINFQNGVTKVNADTFNTFQNNIDEAKAEKSEQIKTAVKSMVFDSVGGDSTTGANITFNEMFPNLNLNQVICFNIEIVDVYETWDRVTAHILPNGTLQIRSYLKTQQVSVRVTAFYK